MPPWVVYPGVYNGVYASLGGIPGYTTVYMPPWVVYPGI